MRILLVASAYNGLCQRAHIELALRGHEISKVDWPTIR
jgi:putative two-component system hydrogenase maturation factor HypX/HoxX